MAIPDFRTLMRPVLARAVAGPVRMPDLAAAIAREFHLSADEQEELLPSGRQRLFYNRLAWAKFHLAKAGMVEVPVRGQFVATAAGRALITGPERIDLALLRSRSPAYAQMLDRGGRASAPASGELATPQAAASDITPAEQIAAAVAMLRDQLKDELREHIRAMGHRRFERLIRDLLVAMAYGTDADAQIERSGSSDGGVDGLIHQDKLGLDRIYLQAKHYADTTVGRPAIQAFVGSLVGHGAGKGVFVTMTTFSGEAKRYAAGLRERVVLIDGDRLCDLLIDHGVGVREERPIVVRAIDPAYFSDEG